MSGKKIIDGLKDAVAGNFARVTIDGQTWVRGNYSYAHMCRDNHVQIGHNDSRDDEQCPLCRADAEIERLRAALKELREAAEHDMKMNQGGDEHEGEPESSGGWWSTRTFNAIEAARAFEQNERGDGKT